MPYMHVRHVLSIALVSGVIGVGIGALLFRTPRPVMQTSAPLSENRVASDLANDTTWYPVAKVVDGDTIAIMMNGKSVTVRLIGVDTPETVDPRKTVQCFGTQASDETKKILQGQSVRIETDSSQGTYDKYGRLLAYVYAPLNSKQEGLLVNKYLIAEGYGHEYTYNVPYRYQTEFKAAEVSAREQKKGLWADTACAAQSTRPVSTKTSAAAAIATSPYDCTHNAYNCSSFSTQVQAQQVFEFCGGSPHDVHKLDSDEDGRVCESLP